MTEIVEHELELCCNCDGSAVMVADQHGYSVWHECISMSTRGAVNQPSPEAAAKAWKEMQR